jgi:hypothetical protein
MLPDFLLLKGDVLLARASSRDELIRASWPFLRVVAHMPDDPRAGEALIGAALVLERLASYDKAAALLTECLDRPTLADTERQRAETALARIRSYEE